MHAHSRHGATGRSKLELSCNHSKLWHPCTLQTTRLHIVGPHLHCCKLRHCSGRVALGRFSSPTVDNIDRRQTCRRMRAMHFGWVQCKLTTGAELMYGHALCRVSMQKRWNEVLQPAEHPTHTLCGVVIGLLPRHASAVHTLYVVPHLQHPPKGVAVEYRTLITTTTKATAASQSLQAMLTGFLNFFYLAPLPREPKAHTYYVSPVVCVGVLSGFHACRRNPRISVILRYNACNDDSLESCLKQ
jgi:hypothetical protein